MCCAGKILKKVLRKRFSSFPHVFLTSSVRYGKKSLFGSSNKNCRHLRNKTKWFHASARSPIKISNIVNESDKNSIKSFKNCDYIDKPRLFNHAFQMVFNLEFLAPLKS